MEQRPAKQDERVEAQGEGAATLRVLGCPMPRWARWPAVLTFTFFLLKGLLWLSLPALIVMWRRCFGG